MKSCSILVSNFNSYEAIKLCLESIHKHTNYIYDLIVYDDCSTNGVDLEYLRNQRNIGWITLIEGEKRVKHGGALNILLDTCETDLAMILDCDIEILAPGWLGDMAGLIDDDIILVSNVEKDYNSGVPSLPDWFQSWFMMINMQAYRDGMQADWNTSQVIYQGEEIFGPTGGRFWLKIKQDNPEGYRMIPVPAYIQRKYHHFAHVSILGTLAPDEPDLERLKAAQAAKFGEVKKRLKRLRADG